MAEGVPITNTLFPPPPEYYKAFTPEAVERLAELRAKDEGGEERERLEKEQDPPRADWVLEDGRWMAFGQQYTVSVTHAPCEPSYSWHGGNIKLRNTCDRRCHSSTTALRVKSYGCRSY